MGIDELQAKIRKLKNPSIVALCPELSLLPPYLLAQARAELGDTPEAAAESYRRFCFAILDALVESVPAVSVESGCFFVNHAPAERGHDGQNLPLLPEWLPEE